jgi:hypothetical protein
MESEADQYRHKIRALENQYSMQHVKPLMEPTAGKAVLEDEAVLD